MDNKVPKKILISPHGDLTALEEGDLVEFERDSSSHWAVYIGNGKVVHLTEADGIPVKSRPIYPFKIPIEHAAKAVVTKDFFLDVAAGSTAYKNNKFDSEWVVNQKQDILLRALKSLGDTSMHFMAKDSEHFATSCRYGKRRRSLVHDLCIALFLGPAFAILLGLIGSWLKG